MMSKSKTIMKQLLTNLETRNLTEVEQNKLIRAFKDSNLTTEDYPSCLKMVELQPNLLAKVPYHLRTRELCEIAIVHSLSFTTDKQRIKACRLASIPKEFRDETTLHRCVQGFGMNIKDIKSPSVELQRLAVESTPEALKHVSHTLFTEEELDQFLTRVPKAIKYLPKSFHTNERLRRLFELNPHSIRHFLTDDVAFLIECIQKQPQVIEYLNEPPHLVRHEAIRLKGQLIQEIAPPHQTFRLCEEAYLFGGNPKHFHRMDDTLGVQMALNGELHPNQSIELIKMSLKNHTDTFHLANFSKIEGLTAQDREFFKALFKKLQWRPSLFMDEKSFIRELNKGTISLAHISSNQQTLSLVAVAIEKNPEDIIYIKPALKSYRLCRYIGRKSSIAKPYSPYED